jgi:hypothetical protein
MDAFSVLADLLRPHKKLLLGALAAASILGATAATQAQPLQPAYPAYPACWWVFTADYGWVCR